jgi:hypothetical protein
MVNVLLNLFYAALLLYINMYSSSDASLYPGIISPASGDVIRGVVTIEGSTDINNFQFSEISFAYPENPTDTWFLIAESQQPVEQGTLALWDTTVITDGNYILRLRIYFIDTTQFEMIVEGLRVRNYSPVETPTLQSTSVPVTSSPTSTCTDTPQPTPSLFPGNPMEVTFDKVTSAIAYGAFAAVLILVLLGCLFRIRRPMK